MFETHIFPKYISKNVCLSNSIQLNIKVKKVLWASKMNKASLETAILNTGADVHKAVLWNSY